MKRSNVRSECELPGSYVVVYHDLVVIGCYRSGCGCECAG